MKNDFKVEGETTIIYIKRKDGSIFETLISTSDLQKVQAFPNTWFVKWNSCTESFYVRGNAPKVDGKSKGVYLHRLVTGAKKGQIPDHLNHDTLDNRKENLRLVSHAENMQNRKGNQSNNTSGIRGVAWDGRIGKWMTYLNVNGKRTYFGNYHDKHEAEKVVTEARKRMMPNATN